jgi:hypothetical protein
MPAGGTRKQSPRLLGIFAAWRLQAYGYTVAAVYAASFLYAYRLGVWLVDNSGTPRLNDFVQQWIGGTQALHGETSALYDPSRFASLQTALVGPTDTFYQTFPQCPIFLLILAPLAALRFAAAFLTWELVTLLGCIAVVYLIVRRSPAIALVLASPFTALNFGFAQVGFLTTSLLGAALLSLERRPVLAGIFVGCLAYKPHYGILFPVALAAGRHWRSIASAAGMVAFLAVATLIAFGTAPLEAFPRELLAQTGAYFVDENPGALLQGWKNFETVYGLVQALRGGVALAWLAQMVATIGAAVVVWLVFSSPVRYALKAATLSVASLIAVPYGWVYDLAAVVIPVAFLARDQIDCGLLKGEQTTMLVLFAASLVILTGLVQVPLGPIVMIVLFWLILRRDLSWLRRPPNPTPRPFADRRLA